MRIHGVDSHQDRPASEQERIPAFVTIRRSDLEVLLWGLATARELLQLVDEHLKQLQQWVEHVRHGGQPGEWRRPRWRTSDDVAAGYGRRRRKPDR